MTYRNKQNGAWMRIDSFKLVCNLLFVSLPKDSNELQMIFSKYAYVYNFKINLWDSVLSQTNE